MPIQNIKKHPIVILLSTLTIVMGFAYSIIQFNERYASTELVHGIKSNLEKSQSQSVYDLKLHIARSEISTNQQILLLRQSTIQDQIFAISHKQQKSEDDKKMLDRYSNQLNIINNDLRLLTRDKSSLDSTITGEYNYQMLPVSMVENGPKYNPPKLPSSD